jgi:hypothetical protein
MLIRGVARDNDGQRISLVDVRISRQGVSGFYVAGQEKK